MDPTHKFTTNTSESINHVIKQAVDWKESKLPVLITHLKTIVDQHVEELNTAVIGRGQWRFTSQFKHLEISQVAWFSQSSEFKEKHMKKVRSVTVASTAEPIPQRQGDSFYLSIPFQDC